MPLTRFLESTTIVNWHAPAVRELASTLRGEESDHLVITRRCFEWVRDDILHTSDHQLDPVTCTASDVLTQRTGFCYAKSHLLAALLRANDIPAGFTYQRLSLGDGAYCLHGLNAVLLPSYGWYRIDARGNRPDLLSECTPPIERLPFVASEAGESTFAGIWSGPLQIIVDALHTHRHRADLLEHLPDALENQILDPAAARLT